jgi:hypothetical protein
MRMQYAPMTTMLSFRLEIPIVQALDLYADALRVSRAGLMRAIVTDWIKSHQAATEAKMENNEHV